MNRESKLYLGNNKIIIDRLTYPEEFVIKAKKVIKSMRSDKLESMLQNGDIDLLNFIDPYKSSFSLFELNTYLKDSNGAEMLREYSINYIDLYNDWVEICIKQNNVYKEKLRNQEF